MKEEPAASYIRRVLAIVVLTGLALAAAVADRLRCTPGRPHSRRYLNGGAGWKAVFRP